MGQSTEADQSFIKRDDRAGVTDSIKFAGHIITTLNSNGRNCKEHEEQIKAGIMDKIGMPSECFVVSRAHHRFDARDKLSDSDKAFLESWGEKSTYNKLTRSKQMTQKCPELGQAWGYKVSGTTDEDKNALLQELGRGHPFNLPTFPNEQFVLCVSDKEVAMAQGFVAKAMETGKIQRYRNAVKGNLVSIRPAIIWIGFNLSAGMAGTKVIIVTF